VVGDLASLDIVLKNQSVFTSEFDNLVSELQDELISASESIQNNDLRQSCRVVAKSLGSIVPDRDIRPHIALLEVITQTAGKFSNRSRLVSKVRGVSQLLTKDGYAPQPVFKKVVYQAISEGELLDQSSYDEYEDLLIIATKTQDSEGLQTLARLLPHVAANRTLVVQLKAPWVEDRVEPYVEALLREFQALLGRVALLEDDELPETLTRFLELNDE